MELNPQTLIDLREVLEKTKHEITLDDIPAINDLDSIAKKISNKTSKENISISRLPLFEGGVWFYQPTIAGLMWLEENEQYWKDDFVLSTLALGYVMAERNVETLGKSNGEESIRAVIKFGKKLKCSILELFAAEQRLIPTGGSKESGELWPLISFLIREYGQSPKYWIEEAPMGEIVCLVNEYSERIEREIKDIEKQSKTIRMKLTDEAAQAVIDYRTKLLEIKKS